MDRIHHICLLNSAACFLKVGELSKALKCCNQVTGSPYDIDSRLIDIRTWFSIWLDPTFTSYVLFLLPFIVYTPPKYATTELLCTEYDE